MPLGKLLGRAAGLATAGLLAALACKSFAIDENVYTGATSSRAGSSSTGGASASPGSGGSDTGNVGEESSLGGESSKNGGSIANGGADSLGARGGAPVAEPEIPEEPFTKLAFLRQVADCTVARYRDFETHAVAFDEATKANSAKHTDATTSAVKSAWLAANASWQVAEIFRFGPAARTADDDRGAKELRDQVYAWRFGGRCPVETALTDKLYTSASFGTSLINGRGLGAAEYLLYYGGFDNACPDYTAINSKRTWAALGETEIAKRKRDYAAAVAADILNNTQKLVQAWDPVGGNFKKQLTQPGGGGVYPSEQAALQAVFYGTFYLEKEVKDYKLGIPLGMAECVSGLCPESLESQYAKVSTEDLQQNFKGFRRLFQGCGGNNTGLGFDDWLDAIGASDLRVRMMTALDGAELAINQLDPPLETSLVQHTDRVGFVYAELKKFTDLFKSEFVTVLDLNLPVGPGTDND